MTLLEKARANRRAALDYLETQNRDTANVVSIFDFDPVRKPAPGKTRPTTSHPIRLHGDVLRLAA